MRIICLFAASAALVLGACSSHPEERVAANDVSSDQVLDTMLPRVIEPMNPSYEAPASSKERDMRQIFFRLGMAPAAGVDTSQKHCLHRGSEGVILLHARDGRMFRAVYIEDPPMQRGSANWGAPVRYQLEQGWNGTEIALASTAENFARWMNFDKVICPEDAGYASAYQHYRFPDLATSD